MSTTAEHIAHLLLREFREELTEAEQRELSEWRRSDKAYQDLYFSIHYDDQGLADDILTVRSDQEKAIQEAIYERVRKSLILNSITVPAVHRVHLLKMAWFRYAAAIIMFIGIGVAGYFTLTSNDNNAIVQTEKPTTLAPAANILPGSNKAILTLSDGRQVELDSAASGTITDQHLSIENNNGQLRYGSSDIVAYNTMTTPRGGQYKVILPDGTKVWLNAASSITYPTAFTGNNRTVNIEGEAYFEVAKDAKKAFIVKTYQDEITVLGTAFNINAYKDEQKIKTSLVEGSVKINQIVLEPGQAYENGKINTTNVRQDIAWKNGVFDFNDMRVEEAARQIARWYDVDIQFEGPRPVDLLFGEAKRNLTLAQLVDGLNGSVAHFELRSRTLYIKKI